VVRSAFDAYPAPAFPEWKRRGGDDNAHDDYMGSAHAQATRSAFWSGASNSSHSQRAPEDHATDHQRTAGVVFVNDLSQTMTEGAKLHYAKQFMVRVFRPVNHVDASLSALPIR
jgi:hypothetical protein